MSAIERILERARWAPSGDNSQPWRFEVVADDHVVVHGHDTRDWCVYDIDGRPSQLAHGALLETLAIAARDQGLVATATRRPDSPDARPQFDVRFARADAIQPEPLAAAIERRTVQRRPLRRRALQPAEKAALQAAVGDGYEVRWLEGANRATMALLLFHYAKLRLIAPEAYAVHRDVIAWNSRFSEAKVPDAAVGLDPLTTRLMAWVMQRWSRVEFFNRYLAGTVAPRVQLDLVPGLACAAHFLIVAKDEATTIDDYVAAGRAMQRLWLTATMFDLWVQPEMTPLIFAAYVRRDRPFSRKPEIWSRARKLAGRLHQIIGDDARRAVFMGRIGAGSAPRARSLRRPLAELLVR
ncbi:MAG TPA: nitroreductase family protein [Casimicrobiaceae bacterium]|nr:nitroreductase family protein [Casimicrobiaceae bacterium]